MDPEGGGAGGPDPQKYLKIIGFLSNTKAAFNVGPSSARQRNAILLASDDCPFIAVLDPLSPVQLKKGIKNVIKF